MKAISVVFVLLVAMGMVGCNSNNDSLIAPIDQAIVQNGQVTSGLAKESSPHLSFGIYADFLGGSPTYAGTATLEGNGTYGVRYFNLSGPPRGFSQAKLFEEYWEIYDLGTGAVYLAGTHSGVLTMANNRVVANGTVEVATGDFEMWLGRTTYFSGIVYWQPTGFPDHAEGIFRLN